MLDPEKRYELRSRAIAAWSDAKRLSAEAAALQVTARDLRHDAASRRSARLQEPAVLRVDRIVEAPMNLELAGLREGLGLVVASRMSRVASLHEALHERLGRVWTARDPADAVGLAITTQPDVALVDDDLPVMSGLDTAVLIRCYAPESSVLLFTDDEETVRVAALHEIAVSRPLFSPGAVLAALDRLVA